MTKYFTIGVDGWFDLTTEDIWPDGDAPEDPSADDVIAAIKRSSYSVGNFLREWGLIEDLEVTVEGRQVY